MATADYPRAAVPGVVPPDSTAPGTADAGRLLQINLERLAARRNAHRLWHAMARALTWGCAVAAAGVLAYRFYLVDGEWWMPLLPIAIAALVGWRNGRLA